MKLKLTSPSPILWFVAMVAAAIILSGCVPVPMAPAAETVATTETASSAPLMTAMPEPTTAVFDCSTVNEIPQSECEALVALYSSTAGANWETNHRWLDTVTPCQWVGVACEDGHVKWLWLSDNQLSGTIPPELGQLNHLSSLMLDDNKLVGGIPSELSLLTNLTWLELGGNENLSGSIPPELGQLANLEGLSISYTNLSGGIPPELGQLTNLTLLSMFHNHLSGSIPLELGQLTNLKQMRLWENELSGEIPPVLGGLRALEDLDLRGNQLSGGIPSGLGKLMNLRTLSLSGNAQLDGPIPVELCQLETNGALAIDKVGTNLQDCE